MLQSAFLWHKQFTSLQVKNSSKRDCWEQFRNELLLSHLAALSASKLSQKHLKSHEKTIAEGGKTGGGGSEGTPENRVKRQLIFIIH